jgi:hypothetical protein
MQYIYSKTSLIQDMAKKDMSRPMVNLVYEFERQNLDVWGNRRAIPERCVRSIFFGICELIDCVTHSDFLTRKWSEPTAQIGK